MNTMEPTRFAALLDAYGADPRRWPTAERDAALALLESSEAARAMQRAAAQLDAELDVYLTAAPSAALRAALLTAAVRPRRRWHHGLRALWRELGGWQLAAPAFAASLAIGAVLPIWLEDSTADLPDEDLIAAMQWVDELPEWTP